MKGKEKGTQRLLHVGWLVKMHTAETSQSDPRASSPSVGSSIAAAVTGPLRLCVVYIVSSGIASARSETAMASSQDERQESSMFVVGEGRCQEYVPLGDFLLDELDEAFPEVGYYLW